MCTNDHPIAESVPSVESSERWRLGERPTLVGRALTPLVQANCTARVRGSNDRAIGLDSADLAIDDTRLAGTNNLDRASGEVPLLPSSDGDEP